MKKQTVLYILTIALINATLLSNNDVVVTAKDEGFSAFHDLVMSARLYDHAKKEIGAPGSLAPFTVFVPTNEAFDAIKDIDEKEKKKLITYHVVPGKKIETTTKLSQEMKSGLPTVGEKLVFAADDKISLDESPVKASIIKGPIAAHNGILYIIDKVLLPAGTTLPKVDAKTSTSEKPVEKQIPPVATSTAAPVTTPTAVPVTTSAPAPVAQAPIQLVMPMQMQQPEPVLTEKTAQSLAATMTQLTQSIQLLIHVIQQAQNPSEPQTQPTGTTVPTTAGATKSPVIVA